MIFLNKDVRRGILAGLVVLLCMLVFGVHSKTEAADNIVQGYHSKDSLPPGLLVTLDKTASRTVKVLPADDDKHLFGVVVDPTDAPVILNGEKANTFVATSGNFQVLVSDVGGDIKPGDFISISNLTGIGQKANGLQTRVVGQAEGSFDGKTNTITTNKGSGIGRIFVQVGVGNNPLANNGVAVPSFLKAVTDTVAGRSVPALRVYAALGVFVFSAMVTILVLWSGVRGSLVALGRNPLSRKAIFSGMYKVVFTGLAVFIIGLAGVYLLLKL